MTKVTDIAFLQAVAVVLVIWSFRLYAHPWNETSQKSYLEHTECSDFMDAGVCVLGKACAWLFVAWILLSVYLSERAIAKRSQCLTPHSVGWTVGTITCAVVVCSYILNRPLLCRSIPAIATEILVALSLLNMPTSR